MRKLAFLEKKSNHFTKSNNTQTKFGTRGDLLWLRQRLPQKCAERTTSQNSPLIIYRQRRTFEFITRLRYRYLHTGLAGPFCYRACAQIWQGECTFGTTLTGEGCTCTWLEWELLHRMGDCLGIVLYKGYWGDSIPISKRFSLGKVR